MQRSQKGGSNLDLSYQGSEPKRSKTSSGEGNLIENSDNDHDEQLPELTIKLLELIAKRLNVVDFCAFGVVCKRWLETYNGSKKYFLESQAPMVVLISDHAEQPSYLYDMANGKTQKVMLPSFVEEFYIGCSGGYVIMEDMNHHISFVNPLTDHEIMSIMPPMLIKGSYCFEYNRVIIASILYPRRRYVILALSTRKHYLHVYQVIDWYLCQGEVCNINWVDVMLFKGHVYVISKEAEFGKLLVEATNMMISIYYKRLPARNTPNVNSDDLKFVVSDNQLLMVDFVPEKHLNIYKMDFDAMKWVKLDKLGDEEALFWGGKGGTEIRKPCRWGGRSNCVYCLEGTSTLCCMYSMEAKLIEKFSIAENINVSNVCSYGWYYPHQCLEMDYLLEEW